MSLVINTGVTARMPDSPQNRSLQSPKAASPSKDDPEIKVSLSDALAANAKEAAASIYNVTNLKALKQRFYKSPIG